MNNTNRNVLLSAKIAKLESEIEKKQGKLQRLREFDTLLHQFHAQETDPLLPCRIYRLDGTLAQ